VIGHAVETWHVEAFQPGQSHELRVARLSFRFQQHPPDLDDDLLALADDEAVDEIGHRLRVVAGVPSGDHQRIRRIALAGQQRHPRQVEQRQHIGVKLLIRQADGEQVKIADGVLGLQAVERNPFLAHQRFHVRPGGKDALRQHIRLAVDGVVEQHHPQVGHAQIVDIREGHSHPEGDPRPVLGDAVVLAADIAARAIHLQQDAV